MMNKIYLDHSATTPVDKKVFQAMRPYFSEKFGNATSVHMLGQIASVAVQSARENIALFLNCKPNEVVFTSGATEANNIAILGLVKDLQRRCRLDKVHIIASTIEHPAVLECFQSLEKDNNKVEVSYVSVNKDGLVKLNELKKIIREDTVLISVMYVNNETGAAQPISEISEIIKKIKKDRVQKKSKFPLYFHTDAVQAANFFSCDVKKLGVDLLSLSGHKIYGPKGIGVLFVRNGISLSPIQFGGHQEHGLRSGTLNVPGIIGIGEALLLTKRNQKEKIEKVLKLRNMLIDGVVKNTPKVFLNGKKENLSPSHANLGFKGVEGEAILLDLDFENIAVSTGSACASESLRASYVLLAMGVSEEEAHGAIRFTLGKNNTEDEIKKLIDILPVIVKRLRKISPKL